MSTHKGDIVLYSTMTWDDIWTRKQRFALMLSERGYRVIYVEPRGCLKRRIRRDRSIKARYVEINRNLTIFTPDCPLPFSGKSAFSFWMSDCITLKKLQALVRRLGFSKPILWTFDPTAWRIILRMEKKLLVHEVVDDFSAYPLPILGILGMEECILRKANLVFVTAKTLLENKSHFNTNTYLIPNGVDFHMFDTVLNLGVKTPEDLVCISRPWMGFVGGIHGWINFDLIRKLATRRQDWSFVFVGPVGLTARVSGVNEFKNVHFLGSKSKEDIPHYVGSFDVCLNPFYMNQLAKSVNPLKLYEYLSMGKPVISPPMPDVCQFSEVVYIASSADEWENAMNIALDEKDKNIWRIRREIAQQHSWDSLLEKSLHFVEDAIARKDCRYSGGGKP